MFDLDNTLYPLGSDLWPQIDTRITDYVSTLLGIDRSAARSLQKDYYRRYGTTLSGLMAEHTIDPHDFLDFVHEIDRSSLPANPALGAAIAPYRADPALQWEKSEASLEDVFIELMGHARDNFQ